MRMIRIHEMLIYLFGFALILAGFAGLGLAMYAAPYLVWGMSYDVPELIIQAGIWLQQNTQPGAFYHLFIILFPSVLVAFVLIFFGYIISAWVDHRVGRKVPERTGEGRKGLGLYSLLSMSVVVILLAILFWLVDYYLLSGVLGR